MTELALVMKFQNLKNRPNYVDMEGFCRGSHIIYIKVGTAIVSQNALEKQKSCCFKNYCSYYTYSGYCKDVFWVTSLNTCVFL